MSFRADRIYLEFLRLTRRLSNSQIMMLLAVVVGAERHAAQLKIKN